MLQVISNSTFSCKIVVFFHFEIFTAGGRADDGGEEVEITLEKNHTFQSMAVYFFSLVGLVVAIELAKRQIQKRHHSKLTQSHILNLF